MTGKRVLAALVLAILTIVGAPCDAFAWGRGGCFGWAAGCYGVSSGCYGASANCYGVSSGCYGTASCYASCNGCYAGPRVGPLRRLAASIRSRHAAAYACTGSCYGSSCYGSSCYGSSCYGSSCYGSSCYGSTCYSSSGCYGSCYAACQGSTNCTCYNASSDGCYASASYGGYAVGTCYQTAPATESIILPQAVPTTVAPSAVAPPTAEPPAVSPSVGIETSNDSVGASAIASDATLSATLLTLRVPVGAKVVLEDMDTRLTGSERTFRTARLAEGEVWNNYCVRVVVEREGGEAVVQEKHLDLRGGEAHELTFDFDQSLLASQ